jgi:putative phosphoesterase
VDPRIVRHARNLDWIVHAGDLCSMGGVAGLRPRLGLIAVAGNNDRPRSWPAAERPYSLHLPEVARLALPGGVLAVEHGHRHGWNRPSHRRLRRAHPGARLVVYGHTHRRAWDTRLLPWILNPGAAGRTRTHGGPSMAVLLACPRRWSVRFFRPAPFRARGTRTQKAGRPRIRSAGR